MDRGEDFRWFLRKFALANLASRVSDGVFDTFLSRLKMKLQAKDAVAKGKSLVRGALGLAIL
jgi:hypothetical protein